ncbi:TPA: hypothetical protein UMF74_001650 [Stenotrophomonas maltophilia]|jgi:hypothetical protein|uniref:hypothetical protein n=1 Tax=Stenotrophomonas sp. ASS1 TaxID=2282124 RepID=UPI00104D84F6|nr:hypothetical protein [Stenotrophomonas sp. ASS1]QBL42797.1 hypothetical protein MG068_20625 [Stenotrophomonas sp. ASS1]HEL3195027.1 hypothetical protein [Stenotrophomonas maltophilia]HEL5040633.1 hypothetical protein [Stenotrophomonas maltophilia]
MNYETAVTGPSAAEALADRIVRNGQQRDPADFAAWLQQSPELPAPADAGAVKLATWQRLMKGTTPFPQANFEQLADRFHWYDRDNIRECYDMASLGRSMHVCWLLVPGNEAALARYMHCEDAPVSVAQARIRVARLSGPWRPLRARVQALSARTRREMHGTLHYLVSLPVMAHVSPPPPLQRRQVMFWAAACDALHSSVPSRRRFTWRTVALALLLACALLATIAILRGAPSGSPGNADRDRSNLLSPHEATP